MTTPNSNNSFFKKYLLYKLRTQTVTFIISALFNILTLPLLSIQMSLFYFGVEVNYSTFSDVILYLGVLVLFVMALTGAPRAFSACTKSNAIDTLSSLPLTRKQHFTADFISGYIANVGAFIPCGIFTIIVAACTNDTFAKQFTALHDTIYTEFFALSTLALFLAYTFAYILSTFVTVCCGKKSISIIFTIVVSALLLSSAAGIGTFVIQCVTGCNPVTFYLNYVPPLGFLRLALYYYNAIGGMDTSEDISLSAPHPALITAYIIIGAALICASYYIFKNRKAERTGRPIAVNALYRIICALCIITITSVSFSAAYNLHAVWLPMLISLGITTVLLFVLEAIRGFKKAGIMITGTRGLITLLVCFAALLIVDKTGAFGARYINVSPNDIESVYIINRDYNYNNRITKYSSANRTTEHLIFTDQSDIEQFIKKHNQTLKAHYKDLGLSSLFQVNITLKNGKVIERHYSTNRWLFANSDPTDAVEELRSNVSSLASYGIKASEQYAINLDKGTNVRLRTLGIFGEAEIPADKVSEFSEMFTREFKEKYSSTDETAGMIIFDRNESHQTEIIYIPESCTETLAYAEAVRTADPSCAAINVSFYKDHNPQINYTIDIETLNSDLGQELLSLLSTDENSSSTDRDNRYTIYSTDMIDYYIPDENISRVLDTVLEMIENQYTENSAS